MKVTRPGLNKTEQELVKRSKSKHGKVGRKTL